MKYTVKVKIKSNGKDPLPDFGLGPGVLAEQEVEFKRVHQDTRAARLWQVYQELADEVIEPHIEHIPKT